MNKRKLKNPLFRRIPRELTGDWRKYLVVSLFLILIIAFIFAVTISNTISRESKTIGTLRASGYTRGELIWHYMAAPIIVTILSAVIGNPTLMRIHF